jgi:peptide/nickel transport system permease protein
MGTYLIRRLWQMIPTMLGVILLVFLLFTQFGGDPAQVLAGKITDQAQIDNIRKELGVDQPAYVQLWIFVKQVFTFDFGRSWVTKEEVSRIFKEHAGASLTVAVPILIIELLLGLSLALWVAYRRGSLTDRSVMIICIVAMSISFLVYIIAGQYLFGFALGWFPVQGWSDGLWRNLTYFAPLPILLAVMVGLGPTIRLYRSVFLDELGHDYVRTARAKGLSERRVMFKHVLRNALIPVITNVAMALPGLVLGVFLLERFFSIPGLGREVIIAVERSDFPVIKAITVYLAFATMVFNLLADLLYRWADPRVELR